MRAPLLVIGLLLGACSEPEPEPVLPSHPCASDVARLDVAPPQGEFGDMVDGEALWCGNPPQGGAPYTPFRVRVAGPEALKDGVHIEMVAVDADAGVELAYTDLTMGLTCANVGDSAGFWVGSEAHMRYYGWGLEELDGRTADVTVRVSPIDEASDVVIEETWRVDLVLQ